MDDPDSDSQPYILRDRPRVTVRSEEPLPEPQPRRHIGCRLIYIFIVCLMGAAFLFGTWFEFFYDKKYRHDNPNQLIDSRLCTPDVTVSLDGEANFTRITSAIKAAPNFATSTFCIHVKAGWYTESIFVSPMKTNVVIFGDGIGKTIIASNTSCESDWCRDKSATLWVMGSRFRAVDLTIVNTQTNKTFDALAVVNMGDESIFLRCHLSSWHTTLNAYSGRQLYRDCDIEGGGYLVYSWRSGARAVFQNSSLMLSANASTERKFIVAAHGRETEYDSGGIVFHLSQIFIAGGSTTVEPLLGLAMGPYASIVYMQCNINLRAHWSLGKFGEATVLFGAYNNTGVVASNATRVKVLDYAAASKFSVRNFLEYDFLVPPNVPCDLDLV